MYFAIFVGVAVIALPIGWRAFKVSFDKALEHVHDDEEIARHHQAIIERESE